MDIRDSNCLIWPEPQVVKYPPPMYPAGTRTGYCDSCSTALQILNAADVHEVEITSNRHCLPSPLPKLRHTLTKFSHKTWAQLPVATICILFKYSFLNRCLFFLHLN